MIVSYNIVYLHTHKAKRLTSVLCFEATVQFRFNKTLVPEIESPLVHGRMPSSQ